MLDPVDKITERDYSIKFQQNKEISFPITNEAYVKKQNK